MSYTQNPNLPKVRMEAVRLVREEGWSIHKTARHVGFSHCSVRLWLKRQPMRGPWGALVIPTRSSRPKHHPAELSEELVLKILTIRHERNQCAELIHFRLSEEGIVVSLSSVKRTLKRCGLTKYSPWKKWHQYSERPMPEKPGILVEVDTIHDGPAGAQLYVYTLLDVCSRFAFAAPALRLKPETSVRFVAEAKNVLPFVLSTIQSDHGSEFSKHFTKRLDVAGIVHRHSRIRTPNDNAHLERFNRTIQEECLSRVPRSIKSWKKELPAYLHYYNTERPHMGLHFKTPLQVVTSY